MDSRARWLPLVLALALTGCAGSSGKVALEADSPSPTPVALPTLPPRPTPTLASVPTALPTRGALATVTSAPPSSRPTPAGSGSTTWRDDWQGWHLTTRRSVGAPHAGQLVHFVVTLVPPRSGSGGLTILWGDNLGDSNPNTTCDTRTWTAGQPLTAAFDHAWRVGRRYGVTLQPTLCDGTTGRAPAFPVHALDVGSGPLLGNGPLLPYGSIDFGGSDSGAAGAPTYVTVGGQDQDGYVDELVLDWGDGTAVTTLRNTTACRWPPDDAWIQSSYDVNDVAHQYAGDPSSHTIVLTVVSSGCHGEDVQRHSVSWRPNHDGPSVPASPPPPRP